MEVSNIRKLVKLAGKAVSRKSPEILTALGITGFVTTVVFTAKIAPGVKRIHEKYEFERSGPDVDKYEARQLVKEEIVELAPIVAPAAISGTASVCCILAAHHVQAKRTATLATAYSLAERTLTAYENKVVETLGEESKRELMQAVSDKLAEEDVPFDESYAYRRDGDGKTLCYDRVTGRYFRSTPEDIKAAESTVNKALINESVVKLSEFYYELGLDPSGLVCDGFGWDISKGQSHLDVYFTSMLRDDQPILVLNYGVTIVDWRIFDGR